MDDDDNERRGETWYDDDDDDDDDVYTYPPNARTTRVVLRSDGSIDRSNGWMDGWMIRIKAFKTCMDDWMTTTRNHPSVHPSSPSRVSYAVVEMVERVTDVPCVV